MRTTLYWTALVVAGCSGSPKQQPLPVQEPAPLADRAPAPAPPPVARPPGKTADATPDKAKGDAREAEFAKLSAGYFDAFNNGNAIFTPDRKRIVLQSNRDGLPQIYLAEVAKPADKPLRLVDSKERAVADRITKDGKALLFRSDTGADENWSIFRIGLDGKNLVELTPGDKLNRDEPFIADGKPDTMFFSARKMSESRSTLYSAPLAKPGEAKAVYTDEMPAFLADLDRKGTTALVVQFPERMENYVLRVDVATGKAQKLWPTDAKVSIFDARFSADGKQIYVATDGGGEDNVLIAIDAKTGKEAARYAATPKTAQISGITVPKKGGVIGLSIVNGDHSEIVLVDSKLKPTKAAVKLPLGQGGLGEPSEDGKRFVASWSTPDKPTDVYAIDPATGKTEALRKDVRETLATLPKIKTSIVEIPTFDGAKIPTIVYVKEGEENKPHPTIVSY
ncbi:MAG TPA: hypothetical protein VIV40_35780, partial [Kofleriaceae bacterium]